ncbi:MAG: hypothetical protein K0S65_2032 [Labilithrix sp.]|nr:hypothetical protein [Labilithrix sp.]
MAARHQKSRVTIDHDEIRRWADSMGGKPSRVRGTGRGSDPGILRIDFPRGVGEERLEHLSWDDWFKWFDKDKLAFLYEPGIPFVKLVARANVADQLGRAATARRATGAKRATARGGARTAARRGTKKAAGRKTTVRRTRAAAAGSAATQRAGAKRTTAKRRATTTRRPAKRAGAGRTAGGAKRAGAKTARTRAKRGSKRASRQ